MASDLQPMHEHYELGLEEARLDEAFGAVELARTQEILLRALPAAPATVADIGGGPGRYALWLTELGYTVLHRDAVPLHVEQVKAAVGELPLDAAVGDARELDLADDSVDAVLLLGPMYHLSDADDRLQALREAKRVVRPGGPVFVAAISRWAPRLHGVLVSKLYDLYGNLEPVLLEAESTGVLPPLGPGSFCGYTHRPDELRAEITRSGLDVVDLVSVEGLAFALSDLEERLSTPSGRDLVLDTARILERVPELLGLGPHLLATAVCAGGAG